MAVVYMMLALGVLALGVGIALSFYVSARRFNRRNGMGLELYTSYGASVGIRAYEGFVMMLSRVFIVGGAILVVIDGIRIASH